MRDQSKAETKREPKVCGQGALERESGASTIGSVCLLLRGNLTVETAAGECKMNAPSLA